MEPTRSCKSLKPLPLFLLCHRAPSRYCMPTTTPTPCWSPAPSLLTILPAALRVPVPSTSGFMIYTPQWEKSNQFFKGQGKHSPLLPLPSQVSTSPLGTIPCLPVPPGPELDGGHVGQESCHSSTVLNCPQTCSKPTCDHLLFHLDNIGCNASQILVKIRQGRDRSLFIQICNQVVSAPFLMTQHTKLLDKNFCSHYLFKIYLKSVKNVQLMENLGAAREVLPR